MAQPLLRHGVELEADPLVGVRGEQVARPGSPTPTGAARLYRGPEEDECAAADAGWILGCIATEPPRRSPALLACATLLLAAGALVALPPGRLSSREPALLSAAESSGGRLDDCLLQSGWRAKEDIALMSEAEKRDVIVQQLVDRGVGSTEDLRGITDEDRWVLCTQVTYCGFAAEPPRSPGDAPCGLSGRGGSGCPAEVCVDFEECAARCDGCPGCSAFQFVPSQIDGYQCWFKKDLMYSGEFVDSVDELPTPGWPQLYVNNRDASCAERLQRTVRAQSPDTATLAGSAGPTATRGGSPPLASPVAPSQASLPPAGPAAGASVGAPTASTKPQVTAVANGATAILGGGAPTAWLQPGGPRAQALSPAAPGDTPGAEPFPMAPPGPGAGHPVTPPAQAGPAAPPGSPAGAAPPATRAAPPWPPPGRPAARPAAAAHGTPASARSTTTAPLSAHGSTSGPPPNAASTTSARTASVASATSRSSKPKKACPEFEIGKNYPGNDVEVDGNEFTSSIADAVDCSALCFEHGAEYFTYGTGTGYAGLCWCKSKLESPKANRGVTSGAACKGGVEAAHEVQDASTTAAQEAAHEVQDASTTTAQEATSPTETTSLAPPHETTTPPEASCPPCAPKSRPIPAIVIPTYERDLCKANFTALSIAKHDPDHLLGDVYLMWVSSSPATEYKEEIDQLKVAMSKTRKVHFHDFSSVLDGQRGWIAQQVLKLKVAQLVHEDFYVVLDSKNTIIRDIQPETFVSSCNQAIVFGDYKAGELPKLHGEWYNTSARLLDVPSPLDRHDDGAAWPPSITPMTFHRQTVLDLLAFIGEGADPATLCEGPLCDMLAEGATEFSMYQVFSRSRNESFECNYKVQATDWEHPVAFALWRGVPTGWKDVQRIAEGSLPAMIVGAQAGALDELPPDRGKQVETNLRKIFQDADLLDGKGASLAECVVGKDEEQKD